MSRVVTLPTPAPSVNYEQRLLDVIYEINAARARKPEGCIDKSDPKGLLYRGGVSNTRLGKLTSDYVSL